MHVTLCFWRRSDAMWLEPAAPREPRFTTTSPIRGSKSARNPRNVGFFGDICPPYAFGGEDMGVNDENDNKGVFGLQKRTSDNDDATSPSHPRLFPHTDGIYLQYLAICSRPA